MNKRFRQIAGSLTQQDGGVQNVRLNVTTALLYGQRGIEDEAIARVELGSGGVPDGEYVLDYFCFQPHHKLVRVQHGILCEP
jgi:hypothetical protein